MTDWRTLCEELVNALACHYPGHVDDDELINRARIALAQPEPEVVGPSDEELLEINDGAYCPCADEVNDEDDSSWQYTSDYIRWLDENGTPQEQGAYAAKGLRAVFEAGRRWGHHPAPPAEGEVAWLRGANWDSKRQTLATRAADLLEQRQSTPVPVAERLPGPEDCDEEGCIWLWDTDRRWVRQRRDAAASNSWIGSSWLPGHALPLPSGEVDE